MARFTEIIHCNINDELFLYYLEVDGKLFPEVTDVGIMTMGDGLSALPGTVHLPSLVLSGGWGPSARAGEGGRAGEVLCASRSDPPGMKEAFPHRSPGLPHGIYITKGRDRSLQKSVCSPC